MTAEINGLVATLTAFQDNRTKTMDPAALAENIRQRGLARADYDAARARQVQVGQSAPDFTLLDVTGPRLSRDALLDEGPVALVFFRFEGCPVCNIALPWYDQNLRPALAERGIRLIAVSPQVPEKLGVIAPRHNLALTVASDPDNALARAFGLTFTPDAEAQALATAKGAPLPQVTGASTWELPMPAVVVIGTDGKVIFADITPDWLARTEADDVLAALDAQSAAA